MNEQGELRVLTVHRCWADMILSGLKGCEYRTWLPPKELSVPFPMLLHAGQYAGDLDLCRRAYARYGQQMPPLAAPPGHIVAVCEVVGLTHCTLPDLFGDCHSWVLDYVQPLTPTPYTGGLGLRRFRFDEEFSWSHWADELDVALREMGYSSRAVDGGDGTLRWQWARSAA